MPKLKTSGPLSMRLAALAAINTIAIATFVRHAAGRKMAPDWDATFEIGIRFWRHQFTRAMAQKDMARGRLIFDSLQTETDDIYAVRSAADHSAKGHWYRPERRRSAATLLYLHGGGYAFHGAASKRFAAMLCQHTGADVFAPDYRLTPEHPHPAQEQDALAAWAHLRRRVRAEHIVVIGDSAGGHMALRLVQNLRTRAAEQPALCIGLCPWTDIGPRGDSLHGNDRYDLVQGWMALQFGRWLDPNGQYGRAALSPIAQDFAGLVPLYLQAGGREVLRDMILDFARTQGARGADVMLDVWDDMPHDFQAFDSAQPSAAQALERIAAAVAAHVDGGPALRAAGHTATAAGAFA